mgnify:FL=1
MNGKIENTITVNKVQYRKSEGKIFVEYLLQRNGQFDAVKLLSSEQAAPEFYEALEALIPAVCELLELPEEDFEERITPLSVSFNYNAAGTMGAVITSTLHMPDAGVDVAINTPFRRCWTSNDEAGVFFTSATAEDLWNLEQEARRYISGQRAQMDLFGANEEKAEVVSLPQAAAR